MIDFRKEFEKIKKESEERLKEKKKYYNAVAEDILNECLNKVRTMDDEKISRIKSIGLYVDSFKDIVLAVKRTDAVNSIFKFPTEAASEVFEEIKQILKIDTTNNKGNSSNKSITIISF